MPEVYFPDPKSWPEAYGEIPEFPCEDNWVKPAASYDVLSRHMPTLVTTFPTGTQHYYLSKRIRFIDTSTLEYKECILNCSKEEMKVFISEWRIHDRYLIIPDRFKNSFSVYLLKSDIYSSVRWFADITDDTIKS